MPDSEGRTALMWAAQRGNYKVLEVMLQKEVDVHAFDNLGGTGKGWEGGHMKVYTHLLCLFTFLYVCSIACSLSLRTCKLCTALTAGSCTVIVL